MKRFIFWLVVCLFTIVALIAAFDNLFLQPAFPGLLIGGLALGSILHLHAQVQRGTRRSYRLPQPKDEREPTVVEEKLAEMNRYDHEIMGRIRRGAKVSDVSIMMLSDKMYRLQSELLHQHDVIPVVDEKRGKWKLFGD